MENKKDYILLTVKEDTRQVLLFSVLDTTGELRVLCYLLEIRNINNLILLTDINYGTIAIENPNLTINKLKESMASLINKKVIILENNYYKFNEEYIIFP